MVKSWSLLLAAYADGMLASLHKHPQRSLSGCPTPCMALMLSLSAGPFVVVEETPERALQLFADLSFFRAFLSGIRSNLPEVSFLPQPLSPAVVGLRERICNRLHEGERLSLVTSFDALSCSVPEPTRVLRLSPGRTLERRECVDTLRKLGYRKTEIVVEPGEFAERAWVIDIFPTTSQDPLRLEFYGDEIETIRRFDVESQRSLAEEKEILLYAAAESSDRTNIIDLSRSCCGSEVYANAPIAASIGDAYSFTSLRVADGSLHCDVSSFQGLGILPNERPSVGEIAHSIDKLPRPVLAVLPTHGQAERLHDLTSEAGMSAPLLELPQAAAYEGDISITTGELSSGICTEHFVVLTGREIFGERPAYRQMKKSRLSRLLVTVDDLQPGDLIVHKDHGIGRFAGLQHQRAEDVEEDFIVLEYAGNDRIYLPLSGIERIQKYRSGEEGHPALDRLGSKRWATAKRKAQQSLFESADRLLKLYAARKAARGFVFSGDTSLHREFDAFFPYDETEDQQKAIETIKKRMQSDTPMDMLLCGDVGYGKTEVAIKAAFRAVYDGKQVAVLVPTTLLAEQHFRTFQQRFSGFPVRIDYLSRFRTKAERDNCLSGLRRGEVDIVIGTHMLLGSSVQFLALGLVVVDEEHRFGVHQKELLKEMTNGVDVLSMTATPIPRTLHMALANIREICTIQTPPEDRLAARSIVTPWSDTTIRDAVLRELRREGQVFFLHNRIGDMERIVAHLRKTVPEARYAMAHGQMGERALERIMVDFLDRKIDVLVCTAIIGSGIDIPIANTIIVDRADAFGLADLYQLRGRVGRGNRQAYAYFLIPGHDLLRPEARQRLEALQEMGYLGAGFRLAMRDLEIRGSGNLLGSQQSGHIARIGFDLYTEMLERAVLELRGEPVSDEIEPQLHLQVSAFIADSYIADTLVRLSLYRRIAAAKTRDALAALADEMRDRFGPLPQEVVSILAVARIKLLAKMLRLYRVAVAGDQCRCQAKTSADSAPHEQNLFDNLLQALYQLRQDKGLPSVRFLPDGFLFKLPAERSKRTEAIERYLASLAQAAGLSSPK
ncbi:MAG TPA: transcription-repair coupling factor [Dissulfurispiraceae bacterium]|nr:transcription-repair coupling factor [Dissulfurispiraceae bacterium]